RVGQEPSVLMPANVATTVNLLNKLGLWYQLSRNRAALSCRDAARKRMRLGHEGIPLWDEMKSFLAAFTDVRGGQQIVMAHCRGDQLLDLQQLSTILQS